MDKENVLAQFQEKAKNAAPIGGIIKFIIVIIFLIISLLLNIKYYQKTWSLTVLLL